MSGIIDKLLPHFPKEFNNYHEPFIGSMSVFLEMINSGFSFENKQVFLSDFMKSLMNVYQVIKNKPKELISELKCDKYSNDLDNYTTNKILFNQLKNEEYNEELTTQLAALFIYFNKTGFNGMYRENGSGQFNIPFGKQKTQQYVMKN